MGSLSLARKHIDDGQSVLPVLRKATNAVHERLHVHPVTSVLVSPSLNKAAYIKALRAFFGFHKAVEATSNTLPAVYDIAHKSHLIESDLTALKADAASQAPCPAVTLGQSTNDLLGMMYVVEGSSLGGRVIAKNVAKILGLNAEFGARFFHGVSPQPAEDWRTFIGVLERHCTDAMACVDAAVRTFDALEQHLWHVHNADERISNGSGLVKLMAKR